MKKTSIINPFTCLGAALTRSWACLGVASREAWPALIAVLSLIAAGRVTAQTFTTLHSFTALFPPYSGTNSDGAYPQGGLILSNNTLYGTASEGGCCLLFKTIWLRSSLCALCVLLRQSTLAGVRYVDVNSTNATPPYTNWTIAATNIQDAVDATMAGDEIVVTNEGYATGGRNGSRVEVDKALNVRSVNGPQSTAIYGGVSPFVRCVYLANGASLSGFTLTYGFAYSGAGVLCESWGPSFPTA